MDHSLLILLLLAAAGVFIANGSEVRSSPNKIIPAKSPGLSGELTDREIQAAKDAIELGLIRHKDHATTKAGFGDPSEIDWEEDPESHHVTGEELRELWHAIEAASIKMDHKTTEVGIEKNPY
ncbi:hypothetical protein QAD02_018321 [Eretmocerus hayati]|uniref:Uncharacterized protein n=1 Tax=Eretmocerus hayati TaxID=131215 RepID=A0ACC2PGU6_9HYME|nr:hypothetical protein QAD02_018321 [Eretmocerus hayati]